MSFQKNQILTIVLIATNFLLTACNQGGGKASEQVLPVDVTGYSEASCLYKYNEGGMAQSKASTNIKATYFQKRYDDSLLQPVLAASASEVVHFAETTGVRYYSTSAFQAESCELMASLPASPYDLQNEFSRVSKGGSITGLYLSVHTDGLVSTKDLAAIIVRLDANKWILVHEFMHHIFDLQNMAEGIDGGKVKDNLVKSEREFDAANDAIKSATSANQKDLIRQAAAKLIVYNQNMILLLKSYYLEEMTIETTLVDALANQQLKLVLPKQRINGAGYTISSSKKAYHYLDSITTDNTNFKVSNWAELESADLTLLNSANSQIESIKNQISSLVTRAEDFLDSQNLKYNGFHGNNSSAVDQNVHSGCTHDQMPDEVIQMLKKRQRKQKKAQLIKLGA